MKKTAGILIVSILMSGCFGSFSLTKKLYNWNKNASGDKFGREAIFLVCAVLPVYGGAAFVDMIILNSVEFWNGKNPVTVKRMEDGDRALVLRHAKGGKMRMDIFRKNSLENTLLIGKGPEGRTEIRDLKGSLYSAEAGPDGKVTVYSADGSPLATYPEAEVDNRLQ